MSRSFKMFNEKSKEIACKPLFKYCSLKEDMFEDKPVVWSLENMKNLNIYFNRFEKFKDFQELKISYKMSDGIEYLTDELSVVEDEDLEALENDEIEFLQDLIDGVENMNFQQFTSFLKSETYKKVVDRKLENTEGLNDSSKFNHELFINSLDKMVEFYLDKTSKKFEDIDPNNFTKWSRTELKEVSEKIEIPKKHAKEIGEKLKELKNIINDSFCCTCLSSSYDNLSNWQNFADGRNGFVIEYDFTEEEVNYYSNFTFLKVKYSKNPVKINLGLLSRLKRKPNKYTNKVGMLYHLAGIIKTKNYRFKFEEEVRVVSNHKFLEDDKHLYDISKYIRKVYLYKDNKSKHLAELIRICKNNKVPIVWLEDNLSTYEPGFF